MNNATSKPGVKETFLRSTLNTINERSNPRFRLADALEIGILLGSIAFVVRYLITP